MDETEKDESDLDSDFDEDEDPDKIEVPGRLKRSLASRLLNFFSDLKVAGVICKQPPKNPKSLM